MPKDFTEYHVRPNVFFWSPKAYQERKEVKLRRKEAQQRYVQSKKRTEKGDYEGAEELLELAVAAWPDRALYISSLADCIAIHKKDPERALSWYDEAVSLDPSHANFASRARAMAALGLLQNALDDYNEALELSPNDGEYLKLRAFVKHRMGSYDLAVQDYTAAIPPLKKEGKPFFEAYCNRGNCFRLLGRISESIQDLETASTMNLTNAACRMSLGASLLGRKDFRGSKGYFESAAKFGKAPIGALNNLGLAEYEEAITKDTPKARQEDDNEEADYASDDMGDDGYEEEDFLPGEGDCGPTVSSPEGDSVQDRLHDLGGPLFEVQDGRKLELLEEAVQNFTEALEEEEQEQEEDTDDVHLVEVGGPGDIIDGVLLVLDVGPRIPGFPVIHNKELQKGEIHYNRGRAFLSLGRLEEANADFETAMKLNATHPHFPHSKGLVLEKCRDIKAALDWHEKALSISSHYLPALYHSALCLHALGFGAESLARLEECSRQEKSSWRIVESKALVLQDLNRHQEALPMLRRVLELIPANEFGSRGIRARIHFAIAQSALALHLPDVVQEALDESRRLGQDVGLTLNIKGLLARAGRRYDEALKFLTKSIRRNPRDARLIFDRSQCYMELGRYQNAAKDITRALRLLPQNPTLLYHRASAHLQLKSKRSAASDLETAATVAPEKFQYDSALWEGNKYLTKIAQPPDLTGPLWYRLGCLRALFEDHAGAVDAFARAVDADPEKAVFCHELAKSLQAVGRYKESIRYFDQVIDEQPDNSHALFRRGLALKCLRKYDQAAEDFEKAKMLNKENPAIHIDYHALGDVDVIELCKYGEEREN